LGEVTSFTRGQIMVHLFWVFVCWVLRRQIILDALIKHAMLYPYYPLYNDDDSLYASRYWLIKQRSWCPISMRLHYYAHGDTGEDYHDHPWNNRTLVLTGGFAEAKMTVDGWTRMSFLKAGDTKWRSSEEFHRIISVQYHGTWSLFIMYRKRKSWSFLVFDEQGGHIVPWRDWMRMKGKPIDPSHGEHASDDTFALNCSSSCNRCKS
jgi:hypothetical protein